MNLKIFLSTFLLIFIAELGDKTQFAAMASAAGSKSPLSVFLGASMALIISSLLAVIIGSFLSHVFPERYLKMAAGVIFVIFGILFFSEAFREKPLLAGVESKERDTSVTIKSGLFNREILGFAIDFEEEGLTEYRNMAGSIYDRELIALIEKIADEEREHLNSLINLIKWEKIASESADNSKAVAISRDLKKIPGPGTWMSEGRANREQIIESALKHERAAFNFYSSLAKHSLIPSVKELFKYLAEEEKRHIRRLEMLS